VVTVPERVGIRELRDNLTALMRRVRNGESIEVTHDGSPVALISPLARNTIDRLVAAGLATAPRGLFDPRRITPRPVTGAMTASEALEEDRADR
jgi:prevent-host-death family protein